MSFNQFASLALVLAMVAFAAYLVAVAIPGMARDRLIVELSKVRAALEDLEDDEPGVAQDADVQRFDMGLANMIQTGQPIGLTIVVTAILSDIRARKHGLPPAPGPLFRGLSTSQRLALYLLWRRTSTEMLRATLFGSRLWILTWPLWPLVSADMRQHETLERDAEDVRELDRAVFKGLGIPPKALHAA
jgi:hypothetical protein